MKKILFRGSIVLLVCVLVFLVVFMLQGMAELEELSEKGNDLVNNSNKTEEDTDPPDDTTEEPPVSDPVDPPEDEDPFDAVDNSNAASQSSFYAKVGSKLGVVADDLGLIGPSLNVTLPDGLTVYDSGTMQFNNTDPGWFYEVGNFEGENAIFPHRLYYRLLRDGEWESNVHAVDGTNFVLYLSFSYDSGSTWNSYQRYDSSFSLPDRHYIGMVAIGLAEDFATDFEGFRLYALKE